MDDERIRPDVKIAVGQVNTIVRLYRFSATIAVAAVAARATGVDHIGSFSVDLPLSFLWAVFVVITFAHWNFAIVARRSFEDVLYSEHLKGVEDAHLTGEALFQEVRSQDTIFLRGVLARAPVAGGHLYRMSWRDPTSRIFVGLCFLAFLAIVPWRYSDGDVVWTGQTAEIFGSTVLAICLLYLNWLAGGHWMVALSQLRLPVEAAPDLSISDHIYGQSGFLFDEWGWAIFFIMIGLAFSGLVWLVVALF